MEPPRAAPPPKGWYLVDDGPERSAPRGFVHLGVGEDFCGVLRDLAADPEALIAEAGLDLAISRNTTVGISYVGQIANNVRDHAAKGKFSWKF